MKSRNIVLYSGVLTTAIILLAGCGGGGGGGGATTPPAATGGAIAGVAAKGILKNAIVTAYCGNSTASANLLASGPTDTTGAYSLKWTSACTNPLKLVVTLGTGTTMADEATGTDVTLPTGFTLSALVADPTTTATKNITPFTDMAVAVAGSASTAAAISNAELAIVNTVLGGDIGAYQATPVAPTATAMLNATPDQKKLATLLTAVSALAQDDATCKTKTTTGDRIQCATATLEAQAAATVTGVSDTGYTVAKTVPASTPATTLATTLTDLTAGKIAGVTATGTQALSPDITSDASGAGTLLTAGQNTMTTAATSGGTVTVSAGSASGIQAARDLFNSLKTDVAALSNSNGNGFLDQQIRAAQTDFSANGHASAVDFIVDLQAVTRAVQMANDAKTWTAPPTSGLVANAAYPVSGHSDVFMITDSTGAAYQFVRYFARFVGTSNHPQGMTCRVNVSDMSLGKAGCSYGYGKASLVNTAAGTETSYFRRIQVAEGATSGSYGWQDSFASREFSLTQKYVTPNGTVYVPVFQTMLTAQGPQTIVTQTSYANFVIPLTAPVDDATPLTGTAVLTRDASGNITALSLNGNIQPLAAGQDNSTVDISAALTSDATAGTQTAALSGTVTNVKAGATTMSMGLASGSQVVATTGTGGHVTSANFVTQLKTSAFQYDGTLAMDTFTANKAGKYLPANSNFTGKVSTLANGTATEFLNGTLGLKLTNLAAYDPSLATSASNFMAGTVSFTGTVTNGATAYVLTLIVDGSTYGQQTFTLNYTRGGTQMVSATGTKTDATNATTLTINGTGNVSIALTNGSGSVKVGTTTVGSVTSHPSQVTFTDGTYLLLGV